MDVLFGEFIKSSPTIAALLAIVILFLRHIDKRDERMKEISDNCHDFQEHQTERNERMYQEIREALEKNTVELGRNTNVVQNLSTNIRNVNDGKNS